MRLHMFAVLLLCAAGAPPASAAVAASAPDGFVVRHEIHVPVDRAQAFAELIHPERWWSDQHTWSGSAANLSLDPRAGGCWCERWPGGEAEHGVVIRVLKDENLRVRAAFGPLQEMALNGLFDLTVKEDPAGGVVIAAVFRVNGPASAKLDQLAAPVDGVIGEQVERLRARLTGEAKQ
jgi:uncharacterized protein YndB with AHSA1/START domain